MLTLTPRPCLPGTRQTDGEFGVFADAAIRQISTIRKGIIAPIPARHPLGLAGAMITEYPLEYRRSDQSEYQPFWAAAAAATDCDAVISKFVQTDGSATCENYT